MLLEAVMWMRQFSREQDQGRGRIDEAEAKAEARPSQ